MAKKIEIDLLDNMKGLINHDRFYDVTVIVDGKEYKVLRGLMANLSEPFENLFYGKFKESNENIVELINISSAVFDSFVSCAYGIVPEICPELVFETLISANMYQIQMLESHCMAYLINNLDKDSVLAIYSSIINTENYSINIPEDFEESCWNIIIKHSNYLLNSTNFLRIPERLLVEIVKFDQFVVNEEELWNRILEWGRIRINDNNVNIKENSEEDDINSLTVILEKIYPLIRYPLMNSDTIIDNVIKYLPRSISEEALTFYICPAKIKSINKEKRELRYSFKVTESSHDYERAKRLESSVECEWSGNSSRPQHFIFKFSTQLRFNRFSITNKYEDNDTIKDCVIYYQNNNNEWTEYFSFTSKKQKSEQNFHINNNFGIFASTFKFEVKTTYGGYSYLKSFKCSSFQSRDLPKILKS